MEPLVANFERIEHKEVRAKEGMVNVTAFSFQSVAIDTYTLIDSFIRSDYYLKDSRIDQQREKPDLKWLPRPFNIGKLQIEDFRRYDIKSIWDFLISFFNSWGNENATSKVLLDYFWSLSGNFSDEEFYVLNKDWFEKSSDKLVEDSICYGFFLLIIWVSPDKRLLTVTEWFYD